MDFVPYRLVALERFTAQRREVSDNCKSILRIPVTKSTRCKQKLKIHDRLSPLPPRFSSMLVWLAALRMVSHRGVLQYETALQSHLWRSVTTNCGTNGTCLISKRF